MYSNKIVAMEKNNELSGIASSVKDTCKEASMVFVLEVRHSLVRLFHIA